MGSSCQVKNPVTVDRRGAVHRDSVGDVAAPVSADQVLVQSAGRGAKHCQRWHRGPRRTSGAHRGRTSVDCQRVKPGDRNCSVPAAEVRASVVKLSGRVGRRAGEAAIGVRRAGMTGKPIMNAACRVAESRVSVDAGPQRYREVLVTHTGKSLVAEQHRGNNSHLCSQLSKRGSSKTDE